MSDIAFNCPECKQHLEAPAEMAGETVECPKCNQHMVVPTPSVDEVALENISFNGESTPSMSSVPNIFENIQKEASDEENTVTENVCPECGKTMAEGSVLCVSCGFHTGLGKKISTDLG